MGAERVQMQNSGEAHPRQQWAARCGQQSAADREGMNKAKAMRYGTELGTAAAPGRNRRAAGTKSRAAAYKGSRRGVLGNTARPGSWVGGGVRGCMASSSPGQQKRTQPAQSKEMSGGSSAGGRDATGAAAAAGGGASPVGAPVPATAAAAGGSSCCCGAFCSSRQRLSMSKASKAFAKMASSPPCTPVVQGWWRWARAVGGSHGGCASDGDQQQHVVAAGQPFRDAHNHKLRLQQQPPAPPPGSRK